MAAVSLRISFPSLALLRPVEIIASLPPAYSKQKPPYKTVWLLHCAMEDASLFFNSLDVEALVEKHRVAVIAPSLGNGYFINSHYERQADFLDEMKKAIPEILPLSQRREDNSVAGISMGAFGALRWALASGVFQGAAAISGVFDCHIPLDERVKKDRALKALHLMFEKTMRNRLLDADSHARPEADLALLMAKSAANLPNMIFHCGTEDYLSLPHTHGLEKIASETGAKTALHLKPGGHDRQFWRAALAETFTGLLSEQ